MAKRKRSGAGKPTAKGEKGAAAKGAAAKRPAGKRRASPLSRVTPGLVLVLVIAGLFVWHAKAFEFTQDDAYISLRYARNLVEGEGLVFNPGERVEGYSNFTWTLLLAAFLKLGAPPVPTATWLGVLFGVATVLVGARFARALEGRWGPAAVSTALLVAGTSAFALWATGGLETALFAFLATAGLERGLAPGVSPRGRAAAPVLLLLAALTRPDGPILFVLWFAIRIVDTEVRPGPARAEGGRRELVRDALLFALPLVPYAIWKLAYYGDLLPNTYYAKAGVSLTYVSRGVGYALDYFRDYAVFGLAPLAALLAVGRAGPRSVEARLLVLWLGFAAYIVAIGGDVLYMHRFWLPILPIGAVLVARGAQAAARFLGARFLPARAEAAAAVGLALGITAIPLVTRWDAVQERRAQEIGFVLNMRQTGEWLGENLPSRAKVAITTIGAIAYYSDLHVIDMLGLTDREIAREPGLVEGLKDTWREVKYNAGSVLRRRPDAILFSTGVRPSSAAEKALFLYPTFYETYRPYFFRSQPNRKNVQVMFRSRPEVGRAGGGPAPEPVRREYDDLAFLDLYGEAHLQMSRESDYVGAAEKFRRVMDVAGGDFPWAREWWAVARYDGGDTTSIDDLRRIAEETPDSQIVLTRLADHALRTGDYARSAELFGRAAELDPDDSLAWIGRAEAARLSGDLENAFRWAREGVIRWDTEPSHLVLLGNLAMHHGNLDIAEWCYQRASGIAPDLDIPKRGLALVRGVRSGEVKWPPPEGTGFGGPGSGGAME